MRRDDPPFRPAAPNLTPPPIPRNDAPARSSAPWLGSVRDAVRAVGGNRTPGHAKPEPSRDGLTRYTVEEPPPSAYDLGAPAASALPASLAAPAALPIPLPLLAAAAVGLLLVLKK